MSRERILITVKTYPLLSAKYIETVCTAGIKEDGSWVRIYPVPFRLLGTHEQYKKYDWIECELTSSRSDLRPDTRVLVNADEIKVVGKIGTADKWRTRKDLLLKKGSIHSSMQQLIEEAHANKHSLATFKPARIMGFSYTQDEKEWDQNKLSKVKEGLRQQELFDENSVNETFKHVQKVPYKFFYSFLDEQGKERRLEILDWEIGALFWHYCRHKGNVAEEKIALEKVSDKYGNLLLQRDLYFFLGTTLEFHNKKSPNPWSIIGLFYPPHDNQSELF